MSIIYEDRDGKGDELKLYPRPDAPGDYVLSAEDCGAVVGVHVTARTLEDALSAVRKHERENRHRIALEQIREALKLNGRRHVDLDPVYAILTKALEGDNE